MNHPFNTRSSEYFKTQLAVCVAQQFRNCIFTNSTEVPPTSLNYPGNPFVFTKYIAISPVNPSVQGNVLSYSVSPALPAGLSIDPNTGQLHGTPTTSVSLTNYIVTASNLAGSMNFTLNITVNFDISTVPGMRLWVRAEGLSLANATAVTSWTDLSNSGNTLISGVSPTYYSSANTINGKPVVRFLYGAGSNLIKTSPIGVSSSDSGSIFFVARATLAANSNVLMIGTQGAGAREFQITSTGIVAINKSGISTVSSYNSGWSANSVHQVSILQNGITNVVIRYDGSQVISNTPLATGYTAGTLGLGVGGADIDIAELFYFDNRVNDQDTISIECYLGNRYATFNCP
ncbi:MAG: Ig domain-containing protein [Leptospira sp.]|nr:Ig domain-containing protein [Leptospira sp.]